MMICAQKEASELEAKMERRSWWWKKKVLEKLASSRFNTDPSLQAVEGFSKPTIYDLSISQFGLKEQVGTPDGISEADIKLRILGEQLMARDELVQQHAKVAEEAVTGWEKAECEAACLKQQLDEEMLHKAAMEEQLVQFEAALKDSMGKLKLTEEGKVILQRLIESKNQELDSLRGEMESTVCKFAGEMTRAAKDADARSRAEDQASVLQKRVDMAEKEQANLKYEIHVLMKELDIRNEELDLNKKAAEAANTQHLEYVKRTAKLEADCQRLRLLLRKRLPAPTMAHQMRMEVDTISSVDRASRMMPPSPSRFTELSMDSAPSDTSQELRSRLHGAEEEIKSLKEALLKKERDLQSARVLCARTASKLSASQEELEKATHAQRRPQNIFHRSTKSAMDGYTALGEQGLWFDPQDGSMEDESHCAESWASALISELAEIKKDKGGGNQLLGTELMDDFAEMEKLASLPFENQDKMLGKELEGTVGGHHSSQDCSCNELRIMLTCTESELNLVKLDNTAIRAALSSIEKHLLTLLQVETEEKSPVDMFEELRAALDSMRTHLIGPSYVLSNGMDSPEVRDATAWSPIGQSSCLSEEAASFKHGIKPSRKESMGSKLCSAVRKLVSLFEEVARLDWKEDPSSDSTDTLVSIYTEKLWRSSELESCVRSLIMLCNGVLNEKMDVKDFLEEVASALEWLVNHVYATPAAMKSPETRRCLEFGKMKGESAPSPAAPEQAFLEGECGDGGSRTNQCIEEQLTQLKSEKEEIDTKLNLMTKELEILKSLLQSSEPSYPSEIQTIPAMASLNNPRDDGAGDGSIGEVKRNLHTNGSPKNPSNESISRVLESNDPSISMRKNTEIPGKELELGGYAEKLADCQHTILLLGKQLQALGTTENVGDDASKRSAHILIKSSKAQRRTQRSFDQLQTICEDCSVCEEEDAHPPTPGEFSPETPPPCSSASPRDSIKHAIFEPSQRDLVMASLVRSPGRFLRGRADIKSDASSPEKHTTGLSRFFSKKQATGGG